MTEKNKSSAEGISRRSFLKGVGVTSASLATLSQNSLLYADQKQQGQGVAIAKEGKKLPFVINGKQHQVVVAPHTTLAELLREQLQMTGTKVVCDRGACGACTVVVDGKTVTSCMTLAVDVSGKEIETIEGLGDSSRLHPVQSSFVEHDALQCGFCTPGMIMSSKNLLDHNPKPSLAEVKHAVSGNLCRCGTYPKVFQAVMAASQRREEGEND